MAYIISCSGKKSCLLNESTQKSSIKDLSCFSDLYFSRIELIKKLGIKLDWSQTLPAYKLYKGRLYDKIINENWEKKQTEIIIVSALFGLIKHHELIPYYNISMTDKIPGTNESISKYWRRKNINEHINKASDIDLLFNKYRKAFNSRGFAVGIVPDILWRDNYGAHKGEWLNQQLNIL
jgi:cytoplasmic iron level regulating protein YaaA (DUF328/UPF0246 family)